MNLHQCIPPQSAHPSTCLDGMVYSILRTYWRNNSNTSDYRKVAREFLDNLVAVGYTPKKIKTLFIESATRLDAEPTVKELPEEDNDKNLLCFIHEHHPHGLTRRIIREIYEQHVADLVPDSRLIVAQKRPKNIKDRVTSSKLRIVPNGPNPSDYAPN